MRVLLVPEVYRPADLTANGTVADAVTWVGEWLSLDPDLHVYWLLPPRGEGGYDRSAVHADRPRVTLIEARPFMRGTDRSDRFTEGGYSREQLAALRSEVFDAGGYVDVVVDQLRTGRFTLYKWLLDHVEQWAADVSPVDVIANVHDLQVPSKYRYCSYRNAFQMRMEVCGAVFADGIWFKAGVDADGLVEQAASFLDDRIVAEAMAGAVRTGSPLDLSAFDETYADAPRRLHIAGSLWEKKHVDRLLTIAETLAEDYGVETILTSAEGIPRAYRSLPFVDAYPRASRDAYERALARGDLTICASEYETMARTWFEQAASGQVLLLRDEPWIYDCVPDGYPLTATVDDLGDLAAWTVEHWDTAVAANRRLVEYVSRVRSPERAGKRTYGDLRRRVDAKVDRYELTDADAAVGAALDAVDGSIQFDDLIAATGEFTRDGGTVTDRDDYSRTDLLYAVRSFGYRDTGRPGVPSFAARERPSPPSPSDP